MRLLRRAEHADINWEEPSVQAALRGMRIFRCEGMKRTFQLDEESPSPYGAKLIRLRRRKNEIAKESRCQQQRAASKQRRQRQKRSRYTR